MLNGSQSVYALGQFHQYRSFYGIMHEISPFLSDKKACLPQHFQMLGDRRFGEVQLGRKRPDAIVVLQEQLQDAHSRLIGDRFQNLIHIHDIPPRI